MPNHQRISMTQVLTLIEFTPTQQRGDQWRGPCPFCQETNGSRSFSVNVRRNLFRCFRCLRSGNQLDLWSAATGRPFYDATLRLCWQLGLDPSAITNPQPPNST